MIYHYQPKYSVENPPLFFFISQKEFIPILLKFYPNWWGQSEPKYGSETQRSLGLVKLSP